MELGVLRIGISSKSLTLGPDSRKPGNSVGPGVGLGVGVGVGDPPGVGVGVAVGDSSGVGVGVGVGVPDPGRGPIGVEAGPGPTGDGAGPGPMGDELGVAKLALDVPSPMGDAAVGDASGAFRDWQAAITTGNTRRTDVNALGFFIPYPRDVDSPTNPLS